MISFKVHFDQNKFNKSLTEIIEKRANEILNNKIASITGEIKKEPQGRFVGSMSGDTLTIKPQGFSEELTNKINQLL